jgi:hypothetical protein
MRRRELWKAEFMKSQPSCLCHCAGIDSTELEIVDRIHRSDSRLLKTTFKHACKIFAICDTMTVAMTIREGTKCRRRTIAMCSVYIPSRFTAILSRRFPDVKLSNVTSVRTRDSSITYDTHEIYPTGELCQPTQWGDLHASPDS